MDLVFIYFLSFIFIFYFYFYFIFGFYFYFSYILDLGKEYDVTSHISLLQIIQSYDTEKNVEDSRTDNII